MKPTLLLLCSMLPAVSLGAQKQNAAASSETYFAAAIVSGNGSVADSENYRAFTSLGDGVVAEVGSSSASYLQRGEFPATLTAPVASVPVLTAVQPLFVAPLGSPQLALLGASMTSGGFPTVTIGGIPAVVGARTVDQVDVVLPAGVAPGFQPVAMTNALGTTSLEEGVGVLPILHRPEPLNGVDRSLLRFHGTNGDLFMLGYGTAAAPTGMVVYDVRFEMLIDLGQLEIFGLFEVTNADGTFDFDVPPLPPGILHVQCLAWSTNPGYGPASFTNLEIL